MSYNGGLKQDWMGRQTEGCDVGGSTGSVLVMAAAASVAHYGECIPLINSTSTY